MRKTKTKRRKIQKFRKCVINKYFRNSNILHSDSLHMWNTHTHTRRHKYKPEINLLSKIGNFFYLYKLACWSYFFDPWVEVRRRCSIWIRMMWFSWYQGVWIGKVKWSNQEVSGLCKDSFRQPTCSSFIIFFNV